MDNLGPFETFWNRLAKFGTISDHTEQFQTIMNHVRPQKGCFALTLKSLVQIITYVILNFLQHALKKLELQLFLSGEK